MPCAGGNRLPARPMPAPDLLTSLLDLLALDRLPRTGWILRGVSEPESVAGHGLGTAHVALALAPRVAPALDLGRTLALAVVHDAPEARTGDLPRGATRHLPDGAKAAMEDAVARDLLGGLGTTALAAWDEYRAGDSREARFVKICDGLQLGVRLLGYVRAGHGGLDEFREGLARLDATEFPPAEELRLRLLGALA